MISKLLKHSFLIIALVVLALRLLVFDIYTIPQEGMSPGLPSGCRVFAWKRPYKTASDIKRGDIVMFNREENGQTYQFIWRVVGLPGDVIEAADRTLKVNGTEAERTPVSESVFSEQLGDVSYQIAFKESSTPPPPANVTVPSGEFFVMGDNRMNARDSRYFGPIQFESIIGKKFWAVSFWH